MKSIRHTILMILLCGSVPLVGMNKPAKYKGKKEIKKSDKSYVDVTKNTPTSTSPVTQSQPAQAEKQFGPEPQPVSEKIAAIAAEVKEETVEVVENKEVIQEEIVATQEEEKSLPAAELVKEEAVAVVENKEVAQEEIVATQEEEKSLPAEEPVKEEAVVVVENKEVIKEETVATNPVIEVASPVEKPAEKAAPHNTKSTYITVGMKIATPHYSNLDKALYYLKNTAHRDEDTHREISSRLGRAILETISKLKQLEQSRYFDNEVQNEECIKQLQKPLLANLDEALRLALEPEKGEKAIEINSGMLNLVSKELQRLNAKQKAQATRVVKACTQQAHSNKALVVLLANTLKKHNHNVEETLSGRSYDDDEDMLDVIRHAPKDAEKEKDENN